jgi:hypothetical protein
MRWFSRPIKEDVVIAEPLAPAKEFSTPVGVGFIDDRGVWYATQREAEKATATRYMEAGASDCCHGLGMSPYTHFWPHEFVEFLDKPDTLRAMTILGRDRM